MKLLLWLRRFVRRFPNLIDKILIRWYSLYIPIGKHQSVVDASLEAATITPPNTDCIATEKEFAEVDTVGGLHIKVPAKLTYPLGDILEISVKCKAARCQDELLINNT